MSTVNKRSCCSLCVSIAIIFMTVMLSADKLYAHSQEQSYLYLSIYDDKITGRFEITLNDLNEALSQGGAVEPITRENLESRKNEAQAYLARNVRFTENNQALSIEFNEVDKLNTGKAVFAQYSFTLIEDRAVPAALDVDYNVMFDNDPAHLAFLVIEQYWKANIFNNESGVSLSFNADDRKQTLYIEDYSVFNGFLGIVKLGVRHIWMGIDHILFLVALILPAAMLRREKDWYPVDKFKPALFYVVKIVTLFTVAHSITLSLAALGIIELPSRLVESVIALSIAVAALDILFPVLHRKIWWVVFVFGLFHGFGFASVLSHLGVLGEFMALSLFGFNLGVEIGQVVVICVIFPVLFYIRHYAFYPRAVMRYGAIGLIMMAFVWFVERAFLEGSFAHAVKVSLAGVIG